MEEKKGTFLGILSDYFTKIEESKVLIGTKERISIPMDWLFTSQIDRAVIERAFINIFCKANRAYKDKLKEDKAFYGKVQVLDLEIDEKGTKLIINSTDGWTKVMVTENKDLRSPLYIIDEKRFNNEILMAYNYNSVREACKEYNLSQEEKENFIEKLKSQEMLEQRTGIVETAMSKAANNLINYYEYMGKKKMKYEALTGTVQQRKDKRGNGSRKGNHISGRISEIYDITDREEVLQEMGPKHIINIDNIEEDGSISKFAYTTYVYENPRGREGYLFVAEPFEGTHNTRVRFVSQDEYSQLQVKENQNKFVNIAEELTEMSNSEFSESRYSKLFKHTSIEKYKEKLRRIVLGEKINSPEEYRYIETDKIIFDGEKRISKAQIHAQVEGITAEQVMRMREALYGRLEPIIGVPEQN